MKASALVAVCCSSVSARVTTVTATSSSSVMNWPSWRGVRTTIWSVVAESTLTISLPNDTFSGVTKLVPRIVTCSPPSYDPRFGTTP